MFRLFFNIVVFLFVSTICIAQQDMSVGELLKSQVIGKEKTVLDNGLQFLKNENQTIPVLEKMEFRTETDEWNVEQQEYLFRMSFNTRKSQKIQSRITENNIQLYDLQTQRLIERQLFQQYIHIIKWHYAEEELNRLAKKKVVLEDKRMVYQKMMADALTFDIDNLLKIEESLQDLRRSILQLEYQKKYYVEQLIPESESLSDMALDIDNWISMATMQRILNEIQPTENQTLAQDIQTVKVRSEELNYDMEKVEGRQILDFVQLKYAEKDKLEIDKEFSLGVGINIPTKASGRAKMNKAMLDIFEEKYKQQELETELEEELKEHFAEFQLLVAEHELIQQYIHENELKDTFEKYQKIGTVPPLTLLRIKEGILKDEKNLQKIEKEACLLFLEIIKKKGQLRASPNINYLSDELHSF